MSPWASNVQIAVDVKHKLLVEQQATNQVVDMGLLTQTAELARQKRFLAVEMSIAVVADKGYFKIEGIEACEKAFRIESLCAAAPAWPLGQGRAVS